MFLKINIPLLKDRAQKSIPIFVATETTLLVFSTLLKEFEYE